MNCHEYQADLGDYVDRSIPAARADALDVHLAGCAQCRALVTDFRTLQTVASSLERRTPPEQVWTRIATAINQEPAPRAWWNPFAAPFLGWRPMLAAGVVVALLAVGTWFSWREVSTVQTARVAPADTINGNVSGNFSETVAALSVERMDPTQEMNSQIVRLEGFVNAGAAMLPGETKAAYHVNDAAIEDVIGQSRAALATEPTDNLAQQSLFEALRTKLALLEDMVALINEMRKGNQEGAARIVSGMEP
jgi:anti-sigma factor RsiW